MGRKQLAPALMAYFEVITCCLVAVALAHALRENTAATAGGEPELMQGMKLGGRQPPCDDIYVVTDGETLHTISDKCGDPHILDHNPHIHDPDDVYPGLVLQITLSYPL